VRQQPVFAQKNEARRQGRPFIAVHEGVIAAQVEQVCCRDFHRAGQQRFTGQITYSRDTKTFLVAVVIHEIGHQYFPMVVNSDERQWFWMDEGLNTFLSFQAEQRWEPGFYRPNASLPHQPWAI
jgi:hypothetical protein